MSRNPPKEPCGDSGASCFTECPSMEKVLELVGQIRSCAEGAEDDQCKLDTTAYRISMRVRLKRIQVIAEGLLGRPTSTLALAAADRKVTAERLKQAEDQQEALKRIKQVAIGRDTYPEGDTQTLSRLLNSRLNQIESMIEELLPEPEPVRCLCSWHMDGARIPHPDCPINHPVASIPLSSIRPSGAALRD